MENFDFAEFFQRTNYIKILFCFISTKCIVVLISCNLGLSSVAEIPHPKNIHSRKFWNFLQVCSVVPFSAEKFSEVQLGAFFSQFVVV